MNLNQFSLAGRAAIVTGVGRGVGRAIALGLADASANVVVAARIAFDIETAASEIEKKGFKCHVETANFVRTWLSKEKGRVIDRFPLSEKPDQT